MIPGAIRIDDESDPRIVSFRGVRDGDLRGRDELFCAESPRVVRRLLYSLAAQAKGATALPTCVLHSLLLTDSAADSMSDLISEVSGISDPQPPLYIADESVMTRVAGYRMHMGALALARRPQNSSLSQLMAALSPHCDLIVTAGVVLTDNIGAIFRNVGSFGDAGVLLGSGSSDPLHRKTIRISSGRVFSVPWSVSTDLHSDLLRLRSEFGFALIAAESAADAVDIGEAFALPIIKNAPRIAVILGSEGAGVPPEIRSICDVTAVIPMAEPNSLMEPADRPSLNVAVASALVLHRLRCTRSHPRAALG